MRTIILMMIFTLFINSANAGVYDRNYQCTQVGKKGITGKYKEVFDGKVISLTYDRRIEGTNKQNIYSIENKPMKETRENKFYTQDNRIVHLNNLKDTYDYLVNIEMTIITEGIFYDTKEYYNCQAIDKYGDLSDAYYIGL